MLYLLLFFTFFKIGLFGFGGGYAMISLIQSEVVTSQEWITSAQFADIVAISQMTPGPIGINSATYVGYMAALNSGMSVPMAIAASAVATTAVVLPSFLLMLFVVALFRKHRSTPAVENLFYVLRLAVVGLLASAALLLMTKENFSSLSECPWQFCCSVFLFIAAYYGTQVLKINPIHMIILCGIAGLFLYY